jgi:NAD(P)-dependent dehydrogenase (short-subunit alcohol dehydrogenase family)
MQIVKDEGLDTGHPLSGRVILITGCSSGIGVETAAALFSTGADIFITARDERKAAETLSSIRARHPSSKGKLEFIRMELDKLSSVREGTAEFLRRSGNTLHVLICNAGVMACPYGKTEDGFETQFGVNHLAHFALFQLLKEALRKSASAAQPSRVVMVSSLAHRRSTVRLSDPFYEKDAPPYHPYTAYGQTKTANIWMALEIERRYGSDATHPLHATALMPGRIITPIFKHALSSDESFLRQWESDASIMSSIKSPEQGAATTVWAAVGAAWAHKGGRYLEDIAEARPVDPNSDSLTIPGYAPWAYDYEGARKLWKLSCNLTKTGQEDEE